jgi:hypothetical protein
MFITSIINKHRRLLHSGAHDELQYRTRGCEAATEEPVEGGYQARSRYTTIQDNFVVDRPTQQDH